MFVCVAEVLIYLKINEKKDERDKYKKSEK